MKLLLDQNPSRRLLPDLVQSFPGSTQVQLAGLEQVGDADIWAYAKQHGFAIVTKDADFAELAWARGIVNEWQSLEDGPDWNKGARKVNGELITTPIYEYACRVLFYHSVLSGDPQAVATFRERGLAYEQAD